RARAHLAPCGTVFHGAVHDVTGDERRDVAAPLERVADGGGELRRSGVLEQIAGRLATERFYVVGWLTILRELDDLDGGLQRLQLFSGIEAVEEWHADVDSRPFGL